MIALTDQKPQTGSSLCQALDIGQAYSLPALLAQVALINAAKCAAAGDMSLSWWHNEVLEGRAPAPAIRQPRCTRWRVCDGARFWSERAALDASDPAKTTAHAKKASAAAAAARSKRTALAAATE